MTFQRELQQALLEHADKVAISCGGKKQSYRELHRVADRIAFFLLSKGIAPGARICVMLDDRAAVIAAMIGILNARAVFVPMDTSQPEKRYAVMMEDLAPVAVIAGRNFSLPASCPVYYWEDIMADVTNTAVEQLVYPVCEEDDSVYVYYTSGSTGQPKGIIGKNVSLLQFIRWEIQEFNIEAYTKFSQLISPYFDAFLRDVFVPLFAGGTICIPEAPQELLIPERLLEWLESCEINVVHCVPSVFRVLGSGGLSAEKLKTLRYILMSGERLIPAELEPWYKIFTSRIQLVNLYGLTETTMIRAFYRIRPEDVTQVRIPIGGPISDTKLLILDKQQTVCPALLPGELYISSPYISKGYLNAPELNAAKFIRLQDGTIAFKTGDLARKLPDGNIDLIGREDGLVKLRGIRVELGEIEAAVLQSGWAKNVILLHDQESGAEGRLVAFVIRSAEAPAQAAADKEILRHLQQHLPVYMLPAQIIEVPTFPLLSNGKVNTKALLEDAGRSDVVKPENETEEKILSIWKEILGDKPISVEEAFNAVGGSSISMMRLIGKLNKLFNVRMTLNDLFNNMTIRRQAALMVRLNPDSSLRISKAPLKPAYYLSASQERLYYLYEVRRNSTAFNLPMCFRLKGEVDVNRIAYTLNELVKRHENLRTAFRYVDGAIRQIIAEDVKVEIEHIDTCGQPVATAIAAFIRPFDLSEAPLLRGAVITGEQEKVLAIDLHHIICDGISQSVLMSDFIAIYHQRKLADAEWQYKDYAEWEHGFRLSPRYSAHREFWLKSFEGELPVLKLPVTVTTDDQEEDKGNNVLFVMNGTVRERLIDLAAAQNATTFSVLFATYAVFLLQLTGQDDLVVGTNTSGRMQDEMAGVAGMFAKTLPIRCMPRPTTRFVDFHRQLHRFLMDATTHQAYDLSDILPELNNGRNTRLEDLFLTMFVSLQLDGAAAVDKEELFARYSFENPAAKYPITLFWDDGPDAFQFRLEYAGRYFTSDDAHFLGQQFCQLAEKIAGHPENTIGSYIIAAETPAGFDEDSIVFNL
ncbi:non-ribosomal peptide synthetase [Chitinophaga varians]|uniref:non-ribosomal peptide synthetase n=1 Tax=Chitinophaga varians TaxID=2202339 RepID=UPI00165EC042|nr:non-ribosomal peptide synthetase [Chitinophaga varians]MBC9914889.1 amino acid adenylation domain-containing protein [Chitinophaga varians]